MLILLAWGGLVLAVAAGGLADVTSFWWLVLVFGAAAPVAVFAWHNRTVRASEELSLSRARKKERELLGALEADGALSPTAAAMRTTLSVEEAALTLQALARAGHLVARDDGGTLVYDLRERDRRAPQAKPSSETLPGRVGERAAAPALEGEEPSESLDEPLSEREMEVLELLASGRTNAEIAADLFVALGTVKAHVNNVYRKLGVRNRAEAVSRARSAGLLGRE